MEPVGCHTVSSIYLMFERKRAPGIARRGASNQRDPSHLSSVRESLALLAWASAQAEILHAALFPAHRGMRTHKRS